MDEIAERLKTEFPVPSLTDQMSDLLARLKDAERLKKMSADL